MADGQTVPHTSKTVRVTGNLATLEVLVAAAGSGPGRSPPSHRHLSDGRLLGTFAESLLAVRKMREKNEQGIKTFKTICAPRSYALFLPVPRVQEQANHVVLLQ